MKTDRIWEIFGKFKDLCRCQGWKSPESEDWIETDNNYHSFLWTKEVHTSSFKKIISNRKCVVRDGPCYHVVQASYVAWLFSKAPSDTLVKIVLENPDFSSRIALYDLSPVAEGKKQCLRLNHTDSSVFHDFEDFLKKELNVRLKSFSPISDSQVSSDGFAIVELA